MRAWYVLPLFVAALLVGLTQVRLWTRPQPLFGLRVLDSDPISDDSTPHPGLSPERDVTFVDDLEADVLFRQLDRTGNARLDPDEMPPALRANLLRWDTDGDGHIDREEFRAYFRSRVQEFPNRLARTEAPDAARRGEIAPGRLPEWFTELDADGDGQIALHEWQAAGRPVRQFMAMDRNGDGFLTPEEVLAYSGQAPPASTDGPRGGRPAAGKRDRSSASPVWHGRSDAFSPQAAEEAFLATRVRRRAPTKASAAARSTRSARKATPAAGPATAPAVNAYWTARQVQIQMEAGLGHANVVFLGDSITDWLQNGVGGPVWDFCFAPLGAEDFAVAGYTAAQVQALVDAGDVAEVAPRVVVLMIGTNDLALGESPATVSAAVGGIVRTLARQLPRTRVLLLGILPRGAYPFDPLRPLIAETNAGLARLADGSRVRYLDIGSDFLGPDGSIPSEFMADYLHPTLLGYEFYAASVLGPLEALLNAGPLPAASGG
jgi:beta-glucosidase